MRMLLAIMMMLFLFAGEAATQGLSPRLAEEMLNAMPGEELPVIITLSDQVDLRGFKAPLRELRKQMRKADPQKRKKLRKKFRKVRKTQRKLLVEAMKNKADVSQKGLLRLLRNNRARDIKPLWIINGIAFKATPAIINSLNAMPGVASIRYDATVNAPEALPASVGTPEDSLVQTAVPELWSLGFDGQGMVVATMDSGVDINHPDLASRWRGGTNSWYDPNGEHLSTPYDSSGHGTGSMGVLVGGDASGNSIGVAPGAQWISVKIFNDAGVASNSKIHQGFQWLLDPDNNPATDDAPDVVNNSWSFAENPGECIDQDNPDPELDVNFHPDIAALRAMGIEVVFSAGNTGIGGGGGTSESPANYPEAFAVGSLGSAVSTTDISSFSSRGPSACYTPPEDPPTFPDLVAPGYNVLLADLSFGGVNPYPYRVASGTSFSAPHAAGIITLLMQAFPSKSLAEIETAVLESAVDYGAPGADNDYGYGQIDSLTAYHYLSGDPISVSLVETVVGDGSFDFTAEAFPLGGNYEYEFWLYNPASGWAHAQAYSPVATYNWTPPAIPGEYRIGVIARQVGGSFTTSIIVSHPVVATPPTAVTLVESAVGDGSFDFTAAASGGSGPYEYEFWLYDPAGGWSLGQGYSLQDTMNWLPPTVPGAYRVGVIARTQGIVGTVSSIISHTVVATPPTAVSLIETAIGDGSYDYTATASGGSGPYEYEFWLYNPANGWSLGQGYSLQDTMNWQPPMAPGAYRIAVIARTQGVSGAVSTIITHTVVATPPTSVALAETAVGDGSFDFTATASGGSGPYEYEFWLYDPASGWSLGQGYSLQNTMNWLPPTVPGAYRIAVIARSQGHPDTVSTIVSHPVP